MSDVQVRASRLGTGEVLVFFDSHCEVTENWLPPLLQPLKEDSKTYGKPEIFTKTHRKLYFSKMTHHTF